MREFSEEFSGVVREILLEYVRVESRLCLNRHVHTCFQRSVFSVKVIRSFNTHSRLDSTPTWHLVWRSRPFYEAPANKIILFIAFYFIGGHLIKGSATPDYLALESCHHYTVTHASIELLSLNAWQIKCIIHISQFLVSWFYPIISRSRSSSGFTHCGYTYPDTVLV